MEGKSVKSTLSESLQSIYNLSDIKMFGMDEKKQYLKNTSYVLIANLIVLVIGFFAKTIIARLLGPSEYGIYALILSTGSTLPVFLLFSLNLGVLYYAAKNPDYKFVRKLTSSTLAFVALMSIVLIIPLYLLSPILLKNMPLEVFISAYILGIALSVFYVAQAIQQGTARFKGFSAFNAISSVFAAVAAVLLAFYTNDPVLVGVSRAIVLIVTSGLIFASFKGFTTPSKKVLRDVFDYSKIIGASSLITIPIGIIDTYFLLWFRTKAEIGYYDIADTIGTMILPFISSLLITMSPAIIKADHKTKAYYDRIFSATVLALTALSVGIFYFSDYVITFILGQEYALSVMPLKVMSLALPAMAITSINTAVLTSLNRTRAVAFLNILLAIVLVITNILLTPTGGPVGAAIANLISFLIVAIAGVYYISTFEKINITTPLKQVLLFTITIALYYVIEKYDAIPKIITVLLFTLLTAALNQKLIKELITTFLTKRDEKQKA